MSWITWKMSFNALTRSPKPFFMKAWSWWGLSDRNFCRVRFYLFILYHFFEHRDQMFWGFHRCSKPENYFTILIEKMKQIQDPKATPTISIREILPQAALRNEGSFVVSFQPWIDIWQYLKKTDHWFLRFKYINLSFSFLKSSRVIISRLTFSIPSKDAFEP